MTIQKPENFDESHHSSFLRTILLSPIRKLPALNKTLLVLSDQKIWTCAKNLLKVFKF